MTKQFNPVVLLIFDGFGMAPPGSGNAITQAHMPNYQNFKVRYPHGELQASGSAVGLTPGEVGSTEVGHLNMGAGRIVYQDLPRINMAIEEGSFTVNPALLNAVKHVKVNNSQLHLMGLASSGNVHSSIDHMYALLEFAKTLQVEPEKVKVHAFLDGRDTPPTSGSHFIAQILEKIKVIGVGQLASISGRYYAMDRDNRWDRIEKAYKMLVQGTESHTNDPYQFVQDSYKQSITDEFITPTNIVDQNDNPLGLVKENDTVIFFNFRTDRARELTKAFVLDKLDTGNAVTFNRGDKIKNLYFVTMTEYEQNLPVNAIVFPQEKVHMPISLVLSNYHKRHLHIAETEKERFTTFFFNGMKEEPFPLEERIFVPSPKVPTYDLKPEMSSFEITDKFLHKLAVRSFDFCVINFAQADMVGHTGNLQAAIKACEALDICLGKIVNAVLTIGGAVVLTADHGNAEHMIDDDGGPNTEHSSNPVPVIIIGKDLPGRTLRTGILGDIAPTVLELLGVPKPSTMTGRSLLS